MKFKAWGTTRRTGTPLRITYVDGRIGGDPLGEIDLERQVLQATGERVGPPCGPFYSASDRSPDALLWLLRQRVFTEDSFQLELLEGEFQEIGSDLEL